MPFTGVPKVVVKENLFVPDYRLAPEFPNFATRRTFFYGLFKYTLLSSFVLSYLVTDSDYVKDGLNNRPEIGEMRIMVDKNYIPLRELKAFELFHGGYWGLKDESKPVSLYKKILHYLWPQYDYKLKRSDSAPLYDFRKDYMSEDFSNHYH